MTPAEADPGIPPPPPRPLADPATVAPCPECRRPYVVGRDQRLRPDHAPWCRHRRPNGRNTMSTDQPTTAVEILNAQLLDAMNDYEARLATERNTMSTDQTADPQPINESLRASLLALNDLCGDGRRVRFQAPDATVQDEHGQPLGVANDVDAEAPVGGGIVHARDLYAAGLTLADVPNLHVMA